ncbi:MAG: hypothetical protein GTN71_08350 [Anaerolineae bacterium]|nr:hypothetical protein [Anaerolineae bacterium]
MVTVRVRFLSSLQAIAGCAERTLVLEQPAILSTLLDRLADEYGPTILGAQAEYQWRHGSNQVLVTVNERLVSANERDSPSLELRDRDVVSLMPPLGGG